MYTSCPTDSFPPPARRRRGQGPWAASPGPGGPGAAVRPEAVMPTAHPHRRPGDRWPARATAPRSAAVPGQAPGRTSLVLALVLALLGPGRPAWASDGPVATAATATVPTATGEPLWEIGGVALGAWQQAWPGADTQVRRGLALPYLIYRGEFLRADRGTVGVRAVRTPTVEVDVGFAGAFGVRAGEVAVREGLPDLGTLVEFGPRLKVHLGPTPWGDGRWRLELPLRAVFDLNDHLARKGTVFEPELTAEQVAAGGWRYSYGVGAVWGDRRMADTFYGVSPAQATATRPAYTARAGRMAWRLSAGFSRDLSRDLRLFGYAHLDHTGGAANRDSPLLQRRAGLTAGVGLQWTWMRSQARAAD